MEDTKGIADIPRTPYGRWEKWGNWGTLVIFLPAQIMLGVLDDLGLSWWEIIGVIVLVIAAGGYLLSRPAQVAHRQRLEADLEHGVVECAIRFPGSRPGSLSDVWEVGVGQVEGGALHFQGMFGDYGATPMGRRKTFPSAVLTREVPDAPSMQRLHGPQRRWRSIHLKTDGGLLQVAASEQSCSFLEGSFPPAGGSSGTDGRR